jgi:hypothetical protein
MTAAAPTPNTPERLAVEGRQAHRRFRHTARFSAACVALYGAPGLWRLRDGNPAALCWVIPCAGTGLMGAVEARRQAREHREDRAWRESMPACEAPAAAWKGEVSRP